MLVALLHGIEEMLAPILDPFYRAAEQLGGRHHGDIFRVDAELRAEAAAHVGRRNAQAVLIETEQRRERVEQIMRLLGRRINDQRTIRLAAFDHDAATFDRVRPAAMGPEALAENMRGAPEGGIDVAIAE